ncbi:hypothetical protein HZC08_01700 [Candidatus Micrarchaeota archaeon]|nr:hypothetical protein [Candidatus Micrarchaeota archaeon]
MCGGNFIRFRRIALAVSILATFSSASVLAEPPVQKPKVSVEWFPTEFPHSFKTLKKAFKKQKDIEVKKCRKSPHSWYCDKTIPLGASAVIPCVGIKDLIEYLEKCKYLVDPLHPELGFRTKEIPWVSYLIFGAILAVAVTALSYLIIKFKRKLMLRHETMKVENLRKNLEKDEEFWKLAESYIVKLRALVKKADETDTDDQYAKVLSETNRLTEEMKLKDPRLLEETKGICRAIFRHLHKGSHPEFHD